MPLRYMISARADGVNPRKLAATLLCGYTPGELDGQRVLVMCHGYNVSDVSKATRAYEYAYAPVASQYDVILELLWPASDLKIGFWAARSRAEGTARLLDQALNRSRPAYIDFNGHSLAAEVFRHLTSRHWRLGILAGAAVPNYTLNHSTFPRQVAYYSGKDGVLAAWEAATLWRKKALGRHGPPPNAWMQGCDVSDEVSGHSGYRKSRLLARSWSAELDRLSLMAKVQQ